ncbi:MAG: GDSL-type esterase/lipase family protein [Bilifractor sp.]|jgi:lysophospholipase L1-like esterase
MKKVLFYGDSNTYGYDPRSYYGGRYPEEVRWTCRLREMAAGKWQIAADAMNGRCIPGSPYSFGELKYAIRNESPLDLCAIMLGTNDLRISRNPSAEETARLMKSVLERLISENFQRETGSFQILLIAPPPADAPDEAPALSRESRKLSSCYRQIAGDLGISFADAAEAHAEMAFDGIHFSGKGHARFASWMLRVLASF